MKNFPEAFQRYLEMCERHNISRGMNGAEDLNHLLEYAEKIPIHGQYVEIGVSNGSSIMAVAKFRPDVLCFGIEVNEGCKANENIAKEGIRNAQVIFKKSEDVCKTWDTDIDMLFIDGEHYWPNIFWDCMGWFPYVKPGGTIMFHDYENPEEGKFDVGKAVEIFRNHSRYECKIPALDEIISTSMVIVRRK